MANGGFHFPEMDNAATQIFFMIWGTIMIIFMAIAVVMYVFEALGLYSLAKRRKIAAYGLAWVPLGNCWILGRLGEQYDRALGRKRVAYGPFILGFLGGGYVLYIFSIVLMAICGIDLGMTSFFQTMNEASMAMVPSGMFLASAIFMLFGAGALIAGLVFLFMALYKIYQSCAPNNAVVLIVLSILFTVIIPFVLFAIRKRDDGLPIAISPEN